MERQRNEYEKNTEDYNFIDEDIEYLKKKIKRRRVACNEICTFILMLTTT